MGRKAEIPALTGLRGAAALLVVWEHYSHWCAPYPSDTIPPAIASLFDTAGLGMSLFFALSGFVIMYNYADLPWRGAPLRSLGTFAFQRFSRLYPALLLFVVVSCAFRHPLKEMGEWILIDLISIQTWAPFPGIASFGGPLGLAWSISTEIGMYLMFAGLMMLQVSLRRLAVALYLAALLVAALSIADPETRFWLFYLSPYFRFLEFGAGALLAHAVATGLIAVRPKGLLTAWLSSRALVFCGTISYSIYLFHDVGAATLARMLGLRLFGYVDYDAFGWFAFAVFLVRLAVSIGLALALAYGVFVFVERPGKDLLRDWFAARWRGPAIVTP
jgi:peptidoglycan/LPS O-acetylase OafA/YrhL